MTAAVRQRGWCSIAPNCLSTHAIIHIFVYAKVWIFVLSDFRTFTSNPLLQQVLQNVGEIAAVILLEQERRRLTLRRSF